MWLPYLLLLVKIMDCLPKQKGKVTMSTVQTCMVELFDKTINRGPIFMA